MKTTLIMALLVLLVPPTKHANETAAEVGARYGVIAIAIADETVDDRRLALFMLAIARHESGFSRDVHNGRRRGDKGRSWGLFQILVGRHADGLVPGTEYRAHEIVGVDAASTRRSVDAAATWLRPMITKCHGAPLCVFTRYGGVGRNPPPEVLARLDARVATFRLLATQ